MAYYALNSRKLDNYQFIEELKPLSLIRHLVRLPDENYHFFKNSTTREYLVDLISQDTSWIENLSVQEKGWFKTMPFIATESGNVYAVKDDKKLYLSAGFKTPKHIKNLRGEYEIISAADEAQHALFRKLGFDEQNAINYLQQIIIPYIEGLPDVDDIKMINLLDGDK